MAAPYLLHLLHPRRPQDRPRAQYWFHFASCPATSTVVRPPLGLRVPTRRAGHICGVDRAGDATWADRCSAFLKTHGVIVASRFGKLRVAPHVYNTESEVRMLCDLLARFEASEGRGPPPGAEGSTGAVASRL